MPVCNIIQLKHLTPLHIGTGKENHYDFSATDLHSDTLSAALTAIRCQQMNLFDCKAFLQSFSLSSAFPFWDKIYFLPKARGKINVKVSLKKEHEYRKQLKRIKYIDVPLWSELMHGDELIVEASQLQGDFLVNEKADFDTPYKSLVNQRVSVSREDNEDADPFFFNWTFFNKKAGLYCLTDACDEKFEELLNLFRLLGEAGLGTDRNSGGGKFEVEPATLELPEIPDANQTMLLSLYIPTEDEMPKLNLKTANYELLLRGGYMAGSSEEAFRHLRKRSVYMFSTGSLFPTTEPLTGKIVDLAPAWNDDRIHPVYRSGRPFYYPIKINEL